MTRRQSALGVVLLWAGAGCARKPQGTPPAPQTAQNVFALLADPAGRSTAIQVSNTAGRAEISEPNHSVRVIAATSAPSAEFTLDPGEVRRLFGAALDVMPAPEIRFVLHYGVSQDTLNAAFAAQIPAILRAIQDRRSTNVSVTGHTDTTSTPAFNLDLGRRRAQGVADLLRAKGVDPS